MSCLVGSYQCFDRSNFYHKDGGSMCFSGSLIFTCQTTRRQLNRIRINASDLGSGSTQLESGANACTIP
jgi:hypothetical protein